MRTDSVNLSDSALDQAFKVIKAEFGLDYVLRKPRLYKSKKGAQEAHEAIRPVDLSLKPENVKQYLDRDQFRLYELIWKRTIACQMAEARLKAVGVDITPSKAGKDLKYTFRATGQTIEFPGFIKVYKEDVDHPDEAADDSEKILPPLAEGDDLDLKDLLPTQHFTKPPARYTEASLVKKLESEGIGRPSTYAPTISTVMTRGYVDKEGKQLKPTDLGFLVTDFLVDHFDDIVDYKFTAEMEDSLDEIAEGKRKWVPVIEDFYKPFHKNIESKEKALSKSDVMKERKLGKDPKSGLVVVVRHGRFGPYVQLGEEEDMPKGSDEKPRRASLPKDKYFEKITLDEAMDLLQLPRVLGKIKDDNVIVNIGPYGPYFKVGKTNVSMPADLDPYSVTMSEAEKVIKESLKARKEAMKPIAELGKDPVSGGAIEVRNGRFGPYVTDGKTNVSIKKGMEPAKITFEEAAEMLEKKRKAPPGRRRFGKK
jgi:DNA topoisomerase-1